MILLRPASERGHFDHGWLDTYHTFSFSEYQDPNWIHFRALRVINEDIVQAGEGFGTHPHQDMEIITYVLEGALEHKDSMKNGSVIVPGDVQRMSAGTGVTHSEYNHSQVDPVHLLQIWIFPEKKGIRPGYEQKNFSDEDKQGRLRLIASRDGRDGSVLIHQDASVYASLLKRGESVDYALGAGRHAWIQVARGSVSIETSPSSENKILNAGDGAGVSQEDNLRITGRDGAEILLFDLA